MTPGRWTVLLRAAAATVWLVVVWVMLWGTWSLGTVLAGVIVAVGIALLLPLPRVALDRRVRPCGLLRLLLHFLRDLVVASVQVAWLAVRPRRTPRNAVVAVRLRTESDLILTVVTELLTLVPGSVVIEVSQTTHTLYAHVIGVADEGDVAAFRVRVLGLEQRVARALGTTDDLERVAGATS